MIPLSGNTVLATQEDELAEFRNLFPLLQTSIYLNSCAKGPLCTPVRQAYDGADPDGGPFNDALGSLQREDDRFPVVAPAQA